MTIKKRLIPLIILATSLLGGTAMAATQANPAPSATNMMSKLTRTLDLTPDQQKTIKPMIESAQQASTPIKQSLTNDHNDFIQAAKSDSYNQNTIDDLAQKQAQSLEKLMILRATTMHNIKEKLTPDQQEKFNNMQALRLEQIQHQGIKQH